jgi:hypothetical protein
VLKGTWRGKRGLKGTLEEKSECSKALHEESEGSKALLKRKARAQRRSKRKWGLESALKMMIKGSRVHLKGGKARRCSRKGR